MSENKCNTRRRNTLLRYQMIRNVYLQFKDEDIPDSRIYRRYIFPQFFISKRTFDLILSTNIDKELKSITIS